MSPEVVNLIASLGSSLIVAIPTIVITISNNKAHDAVVDEKIENLIQQVNKHNNLIERMVVVEQSTKSAHHRIDALERQIPEFKEVRKHEE